MANWIWDRNVFFVRYQLDPAKKDQFLEIFMTLLNAVEAYYDRGCTFAFHGFARDPNEFIILASWDEAVASELRADPAWQDCTAKMMDCCVAPMRFEYFAGLTTDRSVFEQFPAGESTVHMKGKQHSTIIV